MKELKNELDKLTTKDIFPYIDDEKYRNLFLRLLHSKECETDEFIMSEAIQIYANTKDDNLKVRILELLKDLRY